MGIAVIIPNVNYQDANLGKVTLQQGVPLRSMTIVGPDEITEPTFFRVNFFPANTSQRGIVWSIVSGATYASIDSDTGEVTPIVGAAMNDVVIRATSTEDSDIYAEKTVAVSYGMVYALKTALVGDGNATILTNYAVKRNTRILYDYQFNELPTATSSVQYRTLWATLVAQDQPLTRHLLMITTNSSYSKQLLNFGSSNGSSQNTGARIYNATEYPPVNVRIKQELSLNEFLSSYHQNNFVPSYFDNFYTTNEPISIFGPRTMADDVGCKMKLYGFQTEEDGVLKLDLRPCTLLSDIGASLAGDGQAHLSGENGLWDMIGKKFYGNNRSTGSFSVID